MFQLPTHILDLTPDIIAIISDNIDYEDIPQFCLTCKLFYSIYNCESGKARKVKQENRFEINKIHEIVDMIEEQKGNFGTLYTTFKNDYETCEDYSFYLNSKLDKFMSNPENSTYLDTFVSHVIRNPSISNDEACKSIIDHAYLFVKYGHAGVTPTSSHANKYDLYHHIAGYQDYNCHFIRELNRLFYSKNIDMTNFNMLNRRLIVEELDDARKDILPFHKFLTKNMFIGVERTV